MFFKYLRLKNFKRTALAGIKHVELSFNSPLQLILGTNGCGKTSVMRQATPWVPEQEHFRPGGEKEFHCVKEGIEYKLISVLKNGWKHEFWRGGENLNPGGTTGVQKELVKRYFGLTQEIYSLLVGDTKFHLLSTAKRRELFTELSPTDLSYALGVHNRLKSALRDSQGVIRHLESRIAQETAKLVDDATASAFADEAKLLNEEIQCLLTNKDSRIDPNTDYRIGLKKIRNEIGNSIDVLQNMELPSLPEFKDQDDLKEAILNAERLVAAESARRQQLSTEFIELSSTIAELKNRTLGSRVDVEKRLTDVVTTLTKIRTETVFQLPEECRAAYLETEEFEKPLIDALTRLAGWLTVEGADFTREAQEANTVKITELENTLGATRRKLESIRHRLEHLQNTDSVDCPKCSNNFVPGERPGERSRLNENLEKGAKLEEEQAKALELLQHARQQHQEFQETLTTVRRIASTYQRCRGLFDIMLERGLPYRTSQRTIGTIFEWKHDLKQAFEFREALKVKQQLEEALEQIKLSEGESGLVLSERAQRLESEIHKAGESIQSSSRHLQQLKQHWEVVAEYNDTIADLGAAQLPEQNRLMELTLAQLRNKLIDEVLNTHYSRIGVLNNRLKQHDVAKAVLADLTQQLEEAKRNEVAYKLIIDELSPTDGLISEQLSGFIASFVKSMNALIEKVWTYPLKVFPCGIEKDELDYRFPIEVGDDREPGSDVSCGSEAQKDFFDFTFALVLGLYIEPSGFPLYLDELGASFDEEHRSRVWQFVRDYIDAGKAPQAFMISHYAANHTAIANADLLVIDSNNVSIPRKHNQHAVLS